MLVFENPNSQDPANLAQNIQNLINAVNQMNSTSSQLRTTQNAEVANDGTTDRVVMGYQQGLQQWGLFTSKAGKDALTTTNLDDFIFNSNQDTFKIVDKLIGNIPSFTPTYNSISGNSAGAQLLTLPHGQTTAPLVFAYAQATMWDMVSNTLLTTSYLPLPLISSSSTNLGNTYLFSANGGTTYPVNYSILFAVDNTNIYIQGSYEAPGNDSGYTFDPVPVVVFVMQETAA